jgi:uncharacterized protein (DUF58 family)
MESTTDYRRYLDPAVLAKIAGLELRARLVAEGYFGGTHRSPYRGPSVEFADHRIYTQGDDFRHIDWKVYGRTNKHYIKQYQQETNLICVLAVDCSESMAYRSKLAPMSKHEYAISAAAALSYLALQQSDSVGLALFDRKVTHYLRPSNNPTQWKTLIHELEGRTGPAKTDICEVLDDLTERLTRRSMVVLISDLLDDPDKLIKGLKHLRYRRNEVILFHVLDEAELTFPFQGPTLFEGLEASGHLLSEPRSLRQRYLEEVERFTTKVRYACRQQHIDYEVFSSSAPLDVAISAYLATRSASIRARTSRVLGGT